MASLISTDNPRELLAVWLDHTLAAVSGIVTARQAGEPLGELGKELHCAARHLAEALAVVTEDGRKSAIA